MTFSTVFFCLLAARLVSDMLGMLSEHPVFDIVSGTIILLAGAILLAMDVRDPFGYVALVMAGYCMVRGATGLSRRRDNAKLADAPKACPPERQSN
ncbi:hypothetical protein IV454_09025 [Massilia antarctica]|uniref:Uncharacterized protein n=1 Tax=Massilia antarctica TaxID=2765360 RepID=A0AA49A9N1_9BURK|nr:hypothetical protein [Massilia antarctica]QPI51619.1 hypothetical protein IV454_09025 [Massilia antarctica]